MPCTVTVLSCSTCMHAEVAMDETNFSKRKRNRHGRKEEGAVAILSCLVCHRAMAPYLASLCCLVLSAGVAGVCFISLYFVSCRQISHEAAHKRATPVVLASFLPSLYY